MQFAFPMGHLPLWLAVGSLILALVFVALRYLEKRREQRLHRFVETGLAMRLLPVYDVRSRRPLFWLTLVGTLCLLLTVAQPHWGRRWLPVTRTSRDVLVLLDVSLSMSAEDPAPSRLGRARQKIQSLLEARPADRFGLIVFAGEAVVMCPLTLDHGYFRTILDAVSTDTLSVEGTDITAALKEALDVFEQSPREQAEQVRDSRAILLISDGEQTAGDAVGLAQQIASHARIYTMGIGAPQGEVVTFPAWMRQYVQMPDEKLTRLTKLDEETLQQVAVQGGGAYVRITPDNSDVNFINQEIEHIRGQLTEDAVRFRMVNRYRWPLFAAWVFFVTEGFWLVSLPLVRRHRMWRQDV